MALVGGVVDIFLKFKLSATVVDLTVIRHFVLLCSKNEGYCRLDTFWKVIDEDDKK